ncbi:hypothetical protein [Bacillus thuringiensis]|nr:hypothetical protein [Bacillus thuringiensis]
MVAIVLIVLAVIGMVVAMVVMDIEEARSKEKMLVEVNTSGIV